MSIKDYIICASLIINIILGYWVYDIVYNTESNTLKTVERSKGREDVLKQQDSILKLEYDRVKLDNKIKDSLLQLKPKEIIVIKNRYYEKNDIVMELSYDSSLMYISDRLKGVKID
jgi:hypothetical protein